MPFKQIVLPDTSGGLPDDPQCEARTASLRYWKLANGGGASVGGVPIEPRPTVRFEAQKLYPSSLSLGTVGAD